MASIEEDLLDVAGRLLRTDSGAKGKLPGARIRRSISTTYYAIFHFLLEEAGRGLIGTHNDYRFQRRVLAREFTHDGMKSALEKVRGANVHPSVAHFMASPAGVASAPSPNFARELASVFADAQAQRHDADYNMNVSFSRYDARTLLDRVERAIRGWTAATSAKDREFKHALYILMLLKGKLRP
jgi:hypothetical protein